MHCLFCNESVAVEDFKVNSCKCGKMTVSSFATDVCKGDMTKIRDMSMWVASEVIPRKYLPQEVVDMIWVERVKKIDPDLLVEQTVVL